MIVNLNKTVNDLEGKPIIDPATNQPGMIGKTLAIALAAGTAGNVKRLMEWARDLHAGKTIDIDEHDCWDLMQFVDAHAGIQNIIKESILIELAQLIF